MHPKRHPLLNNGNLLEMLLQSPFWVFFYGTGLIFFLQLSTWIVYGLGWHIHPKLYPMPHTAFLDFYAETILWLKKESDFGKRRPLLTKTLIYAITLLVIIGVPYLFIYYFEYLIWLYLEEPVGLSQKIMQLLSDGSK